MRRDYKLCVSWCAGVWEGSHPTNVAASLSKQEGVGQKEGVLCVHVRGGDEL